jgi:predicted ATP-dependent serine protease
MESNMNDYTSISKIKGETVKRVSTGHDELDWLYGLSKDDNIYQWGIPIRTISTWVGEGGVGKSRLAINLAKYKVSHGKKVLYLQNEVDLATLAGWVGDTSKMQGFYCSDTTALAEQVAMVKELRPDFVFVDSINLIDEFGSGTAKSIKTIVDGFRDAIEGLETHVVILCQLNKEGKATGSTALSHLPDINLHLTNTEDDGIFAVTIGKKHRYGRKGKTYTSLWRHIETGVECISNNRFADDRWIVPDSYKTEFIDFGERRQRSNTESGIPVLPDDFVIDPISSGGGLPPMGFGGPLLVSNKAPLTLETCTPGVREAYLEIHSEDKPEKLLGKFVKFVKKNWGIK